MSNLEINTTSTGQGMLIRCEGRLDANHTVHLNDVIDQLVREGHYHIIIDFSALEYLSSAGIRLLVSQYKTLSAVNGSFYLSAVSEAVDQILKMVGMADMLTCKPAHRDIEKNKPDTENCITEFNYRFSLSALNNNCMHAEFTGNPQQMMEGSFTDKDAVSIEAKEGLYALGLGAIGADFESCKNRFGEFLMIDGNMAYLPADGSKKPDYMMNSGQLKGHLTSLYGIRLEGDLSHFIRFANEDKETTLGLSQLIQSVSKLTTQNDFAIIIIAEISGLVGVSVNQSPVDGKNIFTYPEVKNTLNFTTEPEHAKMLAVCLGYCTKHATAEIQKFVRPLSPSSDFHAHFHTAVFPYIPLKKTNIDVHETVAALFDSGTLTDILHLIYDSREIAGLGESQFIHGYCWIAPVNSIKFNTNKA
ncbi:MAG: STAS domain-containing protein [Paludibacter sp.]|nr:STAS domain-containing protein [Paludibacter sp.]